MSRRAPPQWGYSANILAPLAGSKTPRWRCIWCMRPGWHTLVDRRLYLPTDLRDDGSAGVRDELEFATKGALAAQMITTALDGGMPVGWVVRSTAPIPGMRQWL